MQINNCRKSNKQYQRRKTQDREAEVDKEETQETLRKKRALPILFISLNISLGTECYSKTDYSKLDGQILKDAVKSILLWLNSYSCMIVLFTIFAPH